MTVDPEIQSLIDWGVAVNERHGALGLAELRQVLRDEHDDELHRRGVVVETCRRRPRAEIPVTGGGIRLGSTRLVARDPTPSFCICMEEASSSVPSIRSSTTQNARTSVSRPSASS